MKKLSSRIPCGFNIWLGVVSEKNAFLGGNKSLKKTFEITNFFCWNHSHSLQRSVLFFRWNVILLMEETLHHLGCIKLQYLSTGSGFLPSTACGQQLSGQRQNGKKHLVKDGLCWITNQLTSQQVPNTPWLTAPIEIYKLGFDSINQRLQKNKEQKNNTIIPLKPQNNLQECASVGLERTSVLSCFCSDVGLRNPLIKRCKRQDVSIGIQAIFPPKNHSWGFMAVAKGQVCG